MSTSPVPSSFRADPAEIRTTGTRLTSLAGSVPSWRPTPLHGADPQVDAAVSTLLQTWVPALQTWTRSLSALGTAVTHAADTITTTDTDQARSWSAIPAPSARPLP